MKKKSILFVCPACKEILEKIKKKNSCLFCSKCNGVYEQNKGIYNLLPKQMDTFKEQEAIFHSSIVDSYHDTAQLDARRNKLAHDDFLAPLLQLPRKAMLLELGCGLGQDGRALMRNGFFVVQSDISPKTVMRAKETAEAQNLENNAFIQVDSENLPFPDNYFDAVFMVASLHHMMDPEGAIKEMKRCTKQNGLLVVGVEPNRWQYYILFPFIRFHKKFLKKAAPYSPGDETTFGFQKKDFKKIAKKYGLAIVKISPVWYLNGVMHVGLEAVYRFMKLKKRVTLPPCMEKGIGKIDECIAEIPILKSYPWHWNVVMKKN